MFLGRRNLNLIRGGSLEQRDNFIMINHQFGSSEYTNHYNAIESLECTMPPKVNVDYAEDGEEYPLQSEPVETLIWFIV